MKLSERLWRDVGVPPIYIKDVEFLEREIERLRARLEVADHGIDGIEARDNTIRLLQADVDLLLPDAERYRWLKANIPIILSDVPGNIEIEKLDAAIDAAMKENGE